MKVYIVRHGQTDANAQGIVQGWLETELNEIGIIQAIHAAESFNKDIDAIFSSDLKRATRTAQEFRKHFTDVPYFEDPRLRERGFGDAAGLHRDNYDWEEFWSLEDRSTIPNAEVLNDFTLRVRKFLDELRTQPYSSVLIVTHGGVLNRVQTILNPDHVHYAHANASILEVEI